MTEKLSYAHERGAECLETFRETFVESARQNYKLTLIARDATRPDGSRDIVVTSDTKDGIRAAVDLAFPFAGASS